MSASRSTDLAETLTRLAIDGVELIDTAPRKGAEGPVAFLHPRSCHGVLVELIEAPGGPSWARPRLLTAPGPLGGPAAPHRAQRLAPRPVPAVGGVDPERQAVGPRQDLVGQGRPDRPRGDDPALGQDQGVARTPPGSPRRGGSPARSPAGPDRPRGPRSARPAPPGHRGRAPPPARRAGRAPARS